MSEPRDLVPAPPPVWRLADALPVGVLLWLVGGLLPVWSGRRWYPYDLEWMEGGMLAHTWRMLHGLPVYAPPTADWIPYVYPPGYPAFLALIGLVTGPSMVVGRIVSLTGALAAAGAAGFVVARHGGSRVVALCAGLAFLGCYTASGCFYDLVRPDGLAIGLAAWAVALGSARFRGALEAAAVLLFLAFTVKHNLAALGAPMALGIAARDGWRVGLRFGLLAAVPGALFAFGLDYWTHGAFLTYLLAVPASHPFVAARAFPGAIYELADALLPALGLAALWVVSRLPEAADLRLRTALSAPLAGGAAAVAAVVLGHVYPPTGVVRNAPWIGRSGYFVLAALAVAALVVLVRGFRAGPTGRFAGWPWAWVYGGGVAATALGVAAVMRGHNGGFTNVYIPAHWVICCGAGLAAARLRVEWPEWAAGPITALVLAASAWWTGGDDELDRLVPTARDVAAGDALVDLVREQCHGPVFSPYAAYLPALAGLEPSAHLIAVWDLDHPGGPYDLALEESMRGAARAGYWACVVDGGQRQLSFGIPARYTIRIDVPYDNLRDLMPRTGWRARPTAILFFDPADAPPAPEAGGGGRSLEPGEELP